MSAKTYNIIIIIIISTFIIILRIVPGQEAAKAAGRRGASQNTCTDELLGVWTFL